MQRCFTSDGDVVNVLGWWWAGPGPGSQRKTQRRPSHSCFAIVRLTITDVDVRILSPTIAVAHVRWDNGRRQDTTGRTSGRRVQVFNSKF